MTAPAIVMREIHRLRRFSRDLQDQLDRFPKQVKAQQGKVARQEELFKEGQEAIKKLKVAINEKEVSLKAMHTQIKKHEKQLQEAADKKEYDALKHQIATSQGICQQLEEEILVGMTELEERTGKLPELEKAVKQAKTDYVQWEKTAKDRSVEQAATLKETLAKLKEAETGVPEDVRPQYNRIVKFMGADSLSSVVGRSCASCQTEMTAQNYNDLTLNRFVVCPACGRILYMSEMAATE